jgi:quinoprotein glucose dehydrogenase
MESSAEYPELVAKGVRQTGSKNFGGPVATAGGIVFIAATPDEKIRAFDTYSGAVLWEFTLPAAGYAPPSVYLIDGRQYLVIAAGGGGKNATKYGDSIVAFALPSEDEPATNRPKETGWIDLFDGKTLNGWVHLNGSHRYTVEDGAIVGRTVPGSRNSFLCTQQEFSDFELELDVMVDSVTNSGIQIRSKVRPFTEGEGHIYEPAGSMDRRWVATESSEGTRPRDLFMERRWELVGFRQKKKCKMVITTCTTTDGISFVLLRKDVSKRG